MYNLELSPHAVFRMMEGTERRPAFAAIWCLRLALFGVALVVAGIILHRFVGLPTPILLNTIGVGFLSCALSLVLVLAAVLHIWVAGSTGAGRALVAVLLSLALFTWPAIYYPVWRDLPPINDVTTDLHAPPEMAALLLMRGPGASPAEYPADAFAELQAASYPDLQPFLIARSAQEAFELAAETVRKLKFQIVSEVPPGDDFERPGLIEAVDRTPVIGFYDDVVIRIYGDEQSAQIDVRSVSRYGRHDLGRNASRVRAIFHEFRTKLESSVPATDDARGARNKKKSGKATTSKRPKAGDRGPAARRKEADRAR